VNFLDKVFSSKPSQREFAEIVITAFEKSGSPGLAYCESDFTLRFPGRNATIFLHNSYTSYCEVPRSGRQEVISKLVAGFASVPEIPSDFASARKNLMPVIRDESYEGMMHLMGEGEADDPGLTRQYKPFARRLLAGLAYDTEHSITSVNFKTLQAWGVDLDQAFAVAKENLWDRTRPDGFEGANGVYWSRWADSYDSSRMLLTELIYRLSVDGDPVAFVPNRDALLVTGTHNIAGLRVILNAGAESHFKQGHPLSPDLFVLDDGVWKHHIPADAELREIWAGMRRQRDGIDYNHQKELLDKLHEKQDVDIYVAGYQIAQREGQKAFSICVWSRGVDSLIPVTEQIAFMLDAEKSDFFTVSWDSTVAVVGDLMEEDPQLIPKRMRVREFPDAQQIAQLRKLAK